MVERKTPLEGKKLLLARGVPEFLLDEMNNNGGQPDYLRHYFGAWMHLYPKYNPFNPDNKLGEPDASEEIRSRIMEMPTYTEYWQERIAMHDIPLVDAERTLSLILEAYPPSETLNALAENLRRVAQLPQTTPQQLMDQFAIAGGLATVMLRGVQSGNRFFADFGFATEGYRSRRRHRRI